MFELAGLATFLDIFQKAFGLIEKCKDHRRQLFKEIIDPVYTELSVVVGDYYSFFRRFRDDLSQAEMGNWVTVLEETKKQREEIVLARNKVLGLTSPFLSTSNIKSRKEDELLYKFAKAIAGYFYASDDLEESTEATSFFEFIDIIVEQGDERGRKLVIDTVQKVLWRLERKWGRISAAYGELRVFCLT
jgi:hypothetical protein